MKKRITSLLLALVMCLSLLPTAAFAEGTGASTTTTTNKTLMLGTSGISDPTAVTNDSGTYYTPNSYIYFGMNGSTPIKWRVLDSDKANDGTTSGMFLLSEYLLGYKGVYFQQTYHTVSWDYHKGNAPDNGDHSSCVTANVYQGSDGQAWCTSFATDTNNFSSAEQSAFLGLAKTDAAETLYRIGYAECTLTTSDKLFFLSARELMNYISNYEGAPGMVATAGSQSEKDKWWLRSPYALEGYLNQAGSVYTTGNVAEGDVQSKGSARPAFNLNLDSVLFTTPATGGKSGDVGTLSAIGTYEGNEWKLTLKDDSRTFEVAGNTVVVPSGETVSIGYSNAKTGENEYISVILMDGKGAGASPLYYGKVKELAAGVFESGMVSVTIPSDLVDGDYTLYVFNEQCNGDKRTDYASALQAVTLTVDNTPPALTAGTASRTDATAAVPFTSDEAGAYYYAVVESGADTPTIDTTGYGMDCTVGANTISLTGLADGAQDIYIVAKDAVGNVSEPLKMTVEAANYAITSHNATLDFGTGSTTKYAVPDEQTVTITNTGNMTITLNPPTTENYTIRMLSTTSLAPNGTATFAFQPKANLAAGTHNETVQITDSTGHATASVDLKFTVEKKPISITGATAVERDYAAGNTTVEISGVTFSDSVTLTKGTDYTAIGTIADADANESGKAVSVTVTLTEAAAKDYTLTNSTYNNATVKINRIAYSGTTAATGSAKYGGSNAVDLSNLIMPGGTAAIDTQATVDNNSVLSSYSISNDTKLLSFAFNDGSNLVGKEATVTVNVTDCTNYKDYTITVTLTANAKDVQSITADDLTAIYGETGKKITATTTGDGAISYAVKSGSEDILDVDAATGALTFKKAGTATVTVSVSEAATYAANSKDVTVTVAPKALTVTALDRSAYVGDAEPDLSDPVAGTDYTVEGLVGEDTVTVALTCNADMSAAGEYDIVPTVTGDCLANYDLTTVNGKLTLTNRPVLPSTGTNTGTVTETTKNPDGSTTTTTTDKNTGTVTETTKNTDGSTTMVETKKDGTVTETSTTPTGTTSTTVTDKDGNVTDISANVPASAVKDGESVGLPIDAVKPAEKSEDATEIRVDVPAGGATVVIPVEEPTPGTVIVIVDEDGNETVVPGSTVTENGVEVTLTGNATVKVIENSKDFSDVKSSDYFDKAVDWASSRGITGGSSATTFGPHDSCTRAQLVTFLWRAAGQPEAESECGMTDIVAGAYYAEAVHWAFENGIVNGYGNDQFGTKDTITREQMAVILYRFARFTGMDTPQSGTAAQEYKDYDSVSDYAVAAIRWAVNVGIMQGYNGNLMPDQPCTRAQIVTMLYRLLGK